MLDAGGIQPRSELSAAWFAGEPNNATRPRPWRRRSTSTGVELSGPRTDSPLLGCLFIREAMARRRPLLIAMMATACIGAANAEDKAQQAPKDASGPVGRKDDGLKPDSPRPRAEAAPAPSKPAPPSGTPAVVLDLSAIESVIGKSVKSYVGEDMGRIVDVLVTPAGQVRAAVIDFGGVLGVGSRKVAVDWKTLNFSGDAKGGPVILKLTRNQVRVSPEYKSGDPVVVLEVAKPEEPKVVPVTPPAKAAPAPSANHAGATGSVPPKK